MVMYDQAEIEHTLDDYERELLQAIETGEFAPTPGLIPDQALLQGARCPQAVVVLLPCGMLPLDHVSRLA
jgi:hypothetical protein